MSQFYDDAAALALAQIAEFGQTVVLARFSKVFDPLAGSASASVATKGSVSAVLLPLNKNDESRLDNSLLEALRQGKLRKLLVAASGAPFEPKGSDVFVFGSVYWFARGCTPLNPAGTPIVYTVIAESGGLSALDITALGTDVALPAYVQAFTVDLIEGETSKVITFPTSFGAFGIPPGIKVQLVVPTDGFSFGAEVLDGSPTADGFTAQLGAAVPGPGYSLSIIAAFTF